MASRSCFCHDSIVSRALVSSLGSRSHSQPQHLMFLPTAILSQKLVVSSPRSIYANEMPLRTWYDKVSLHGVKVSHSVSHYTKARVLSLYRRRCTLTIHLMFNQVTCQQHPCWSQKSKHLALCTRLSPTFAVVNHLQYIAKR